jgi:hypothetical protein
MKMGIALLMAGSVVALCGCYHPPYSYDVRGNGEGGVTLTTVPDQEEPWRNPPPSPPPIIVYLPATAPATPPAPEAIPPTPPSPVTQPDDKQRIEALEAKVRELAAENARLKQQSPAPTTMPANNP